MQRAGIDVRSDMVGLNERRNWVDWSTEQILECDYVIVVASETYLAGSRGTLRTNGGVGVRSEYVRLVDLLHLDFEQWIKKILPVLLPGHTKDEIPLAFLPNTADHYVINGFTRKGAASLLYVLRGSRRPV
jgi:hypothetical protein